MSEPTVLIGILTYDGQKYCRKLFFNFLKTLSYPNIEFLIVTNSGEADKEDLEAHAEPLRAIGRKVTVLVDDRKTERPFDVVVNGRNLIRDEFLKGGWVYLYYLDSDVIGPKNQIEALVRHKKQLITGVYLNFFEDEGGKEHVAPVLFVDAGDGKSKMVHIAQILRPRLLKVKLAGMGSCLIARAILEQVCFRRLDGVEVGGEDTAFFLDARARGWDLWCDTAVLCWHVKFPLEDQRNILLDPRRYKLKVRAQEP